jgi:hypothetical protein
MIGKKNISKEKVASALKMVELSDQHHKRWTTTEGANRQSSNQRTEVANLG